MKRCFILMMIAMIFSPVMLAQKGLTERHQPIKLGGVWIDNGNGREVTITQSGASVKATYNRDYRCSHGKREKTEIDFDEANIDQVTVTGLMSVCVYGQAGVADGTVKKVPVRLTISGDHQTMTGKYGTYGGRDDQNAVSFTRCALGQKCP